MFIIFIILLVLAIKTLFYNVIFHVTCFKLHFRHVTIYVNFSPITLKLDLSHKKIHFHGNIYYLQQFNNKNVIAEYNGCRIKHTAEIAHKFHHKIELYNYHFIGWSIMNVCCTIKYYHWDKRHILISSHVYAHIYNI